MKVIIAGPRTCTNWREMGVAIGKAAHEGIEVTELVCGMAHGVDLMAWDWATRLGLPIKEFPALWDDVTVPGALVRYRNGKAYNAAAGPQRNQKMADYAAPAGGLIALWDGISKGTGDMITRANKAKLKVSIHRIF